MVNMQRERRTGLAPAAVHGYQCPRCSCTANMHNQIILPTADSTELQHCLNLKYLRWEQSREAVIDSFNNTYTDRKDPRNLHR